MSSVRKIFKQNPFLVSFFFFLAILLISLLVCLLLLKSIADQQIRSANERYDSYQLADELRQTSDDLTKMVRLYVVTGDKKYRQYFNEILSIRNGLSPRPLKYNQIYWDLVTDSTRPRSFSRAKSLNALLIEHGFTLSEYALLKEAENRSNDLAKLETKAMNAMEGKFEDASGKYTLTGKPNPELARQLVFSTQYEEAKANIMLPLQKFFESVETRTARQYNILNRRMLWVIALAIILSALSTIVMIISIVKALRTLHQASKETDLLLLNILPGPIADRLKKGEELIADEFPQASVMFADIVGFTQMTFKFGATKMVRILNELFEEFDNAVEKYGVEKVKTIGDNYMAIAGVPIQTTDHATRLANYALEIMHRLKEFNKRNNYDFQMRVGMTYGAVVAGVIGHKKFIYDVWGDVVNTASRMESTSIPGHIQLTEKMALMLEDNFIVEPREEEIDVKGIGRMRTYFLKGRKHEETPSQNS